MRDFMLQQVINAMKAKGYKIFDRPYMLNIVGVRSSDKKINMFNDVICVFFKDGVGNWVYRAYPASTKPGKPLLLKPINSNGCAILVPKQYVDAYKIDLHNGKYKALCERVMPVEVYRDNDRDEELDLGNIEKGYFGINIHRASQWQKLMFVDRNSAGCQVIQDSKDFDELMGFAYRQTMSYPNLFSYTLLNEADIV